MVKYLRGGKRKLLPYVFKTVKLYVPDFAVIDITVVSEKIALKEIKLVRSRKPVVNRLHKPVGKRPRLRDHRFAHNEQIFLAAYYIVSLVFGKRRGYYHSLRRRRYFLQYAVLHRSKTRKAVERRHRAAKKRRPFHNA